MKHPELAIDDTRPPPMIAYLRRVSKIALLSAVFSVICMAGAIYLLATQSSGDYTQIFSSHLLSKRQLLPVLVLSGMTLIAITGLLTWLIALYSTYRVAGPLHHFAMNLEKEIAEGPLPMEKLRADDLLQEEYLVLSGSAQRLQVYYDTISELVDLARIQFELPDPNLGEGLRKTIVQIKNMERLLQL